MPVQVMDAIRARLDAETGLVQLDPAVAEPGDQVRVFDGPLAGLSGLFKARAGDQRALVLMELLGRQTTIEIESLLLQKTN
jgi:transcriptional antiterminator RfaH